MTKYFEINVNKHNIRCKSYVGDPKKVKRMVIFLTGFAGHKDHGAAEKFADRMLSKYKDIAVLTFNWPSHGDDVKKRITLQDCLEYLSLVLDYVRDTYDAPKVYAYTISYGGYVVLRYINLFGNPFQKLALRCPAVNMHESLTQSIMRRDEYDLILKGKAVPVGFDRKIEVGPDFLQELAEADIRKMSFLDYADDILMIQGTADEVIPYDEVHAFSEDNVIELLTVEGADHRFQNPNHLEIVTKAVIEHFGF